MKLPQVQWSPTEDNGRHLPANIASYTNRALRGARYLPTGDERILLVDDDSLVRHGVQRILDELRYDVECFSDGLEVIAHLNDAATVPADLVLTDYDMPNCDGYRLAQHLRQHHPGLRVLLCSAWPEECIKPSEQAPDWPPFLAKPFQFEVLAHKLREVLDAGQCVRRSAQSGSRR